MLAKESEAGGWTHTPASSGSSNGTEEVNMYICYWCGEKLNDCPVCYNMDGRMETCSHCDRTGFLCSEHGTNWIGHVSCPPDHEAVIDNWISSNMRGSRGEGLTLDDLPYRGEDELSYIAFIADLNAAMPERQFSNEGLATVAWLKRCRDLAIAAGGRRPNVLRAGPVSASESS